MTDKKYKKKNKKSILVRTALWEAYEEKCFYCGEYLYYNNLEIDHILPDSIQYQPQRFEKIKEEYGLDSNFEINSYYNLVPSNTGCNRKKSNHLYNKKRTIFFLSEAERHIKKIEKIENRLEKERNKTKELNRLGINIENGFLKKKEVLDFLNSIESIELQEPLVISFIFHMKNVYNRIPKIAQKTDYESFKWLENNLLKQFSKQLGGTFSILDTNYQISDIYILKIAFWGVDLDAFDSFKNPFWSVYEINTFDELYRLSVKRYYNYSIKFTRPIFKSKNWDRLKIIPSNKITTEIILGVKPKFKLKPGIYNINRQEIEFEIDEKNNITIIRINRKILEHEYKPQKSITKEFEPLPQKIPYFIKDILNSIFKLNKVPKEKYLDDFHSISIIVNYKFRNKVIATTEYLKIESPRALKFDGTVYYLPAINEEKFILESNNSKEWNNRGIIYYNQKNIQEAEFCYKRALEIDPKNSSALANLGLLYGKQNKYFLAKRLIRRSVNIDPLNIIAWLNLGIAYEKLKKYKKAETCFMKVLEQDNQNINALYFLGNVKNSQKNYPEAEMYLIKAIKLDNKHKSAWIGLGVAYEKQKHYLKAQCCYKKAVKIYNKNIVAWSNLGRFYETLKDHNKAENCFRRILEIDPNNVCALKDIGLIYAKQNKDNEAKEFFKKAVKLHDKYDLACKYLGILYMNQKKYFKARFYYEKALKINPNDANRWNNLGLIYINLNNLTCAQICWRKVLELDHNNNYALNNLKKSFEDKGTYKIKELIYRKAVDLEPNNSKAWTDLGKLYINQNKTNNAKYCFKKALKINSQDSFSINALGIIYIEEENNEKAAHYWKKAVKIDPMNAAAWVNLGIFHLDENNYKEANHCYEKAKNLNIKNKKNLENFERLKRELKTE